MKIIKKIVLLCCIVCMCCCTGCGSENKQKSKEEAKSEGFYMCGIYKRQMKDCARHYVELIKYCSGEDFEKDWALLQEGVYTQQEFYDCVIQRMDFSGDYNGKMSAPTGSILAGQNVPSEKYTREAFGETLQAWFRSNYDVTMPSIQERVTKLQGTQYYEALKNLYVKMEGFVNFIDFKNILSGIKDSSFYERQRDKAEAWMREIDSLVEELCVDLDITGV